MMTWLEVLVGAALGASGAAAHLALVWLRAKWVTQGHPRRAWVTFPFSLLPAAAAVLAAAHISARAAWATLLGVALVHVTALSRHRSSA